MRSLIDSRLHHQEIPQDAVAFISIRVALITEMYLAEKCADLRFFFERDSASPPCAAFAEPIMRQLVA